MSGENALELGPPEVVAPIGGRAARRAAVLGSPVSHSRSPDLHLAAYHWPAFNLADVAVVTGTALLLLDGLRDAKRKAATGL